MLSKILKKEYILFLLVLILGFFLRAQETLSNNYIFLLDQGRDMMAVKGIVFDHHLTLIGPYTSLQGVFQGPLYYYLLAIPTFLTNGNPWGPLTLMLLISMAVLVAVFFFLKKDFGIFTALLATYFFAISPEAQAAATYIWNPHPMYLIITCYIFILYKIITGKKKYHLLLWSLLSFSFHFETALGVFLVISTIIYFISFQRKALKTKYFAYGIFLSSIFFLPQVIFDIRHDFLMTKSIMNVFSGTSSQGLLVQGEGKNYSQLVSDHLQAFYINFNSGFMQQGDLKNLPTLILIFMIISTLMMTRSKLWNKNEKKLAFSITAIILFNIALSFVYPFPIRSWFLTGFQSFYIILFAILLSPLRKFLLGKIAIGLLILITLIYSFFRLDVLYFHPPDDGGVSKVKGKLHAIDLVYKDAKGNPFGLLVFTPPVKTDPYDYLIWWHGKRKYNYVPHQEKKDTFYLLMEQDPYKPWSYKGWMETVIITGTVIETKTLPEGFIIQKRKADLINN